MAIVKIPYTDLGGVPLAFDTDRDLIHQDPDWVYRYAPHESVNPYGPGDVFKMPGEGGRLVDYNEALSRALVLTAPVLSPSHQQPGQTAPSRTPATSTGSQVGSGIGSATETTISQLWKFLERPVWSDDTNSLSTGIVLGGLGVLYFLIRPKRRRR